MGYVLNFLNQSIPLGIVVFFGYIAIRLTVLLVRISQDTKHINEKLDNHITDTNKKIDKLGAKIEKLEAGQNKLEVGQAKIENKLDQLLKKS